MGSLPINRMPLGRVHPYQPQCEGKSGTLERSPSSLNIGRSNFKLRVTILLHIDQDFQRIDFNCHPVALMAKSARLANMFETKCHWIHQNHHVLKLRTIPHRIFSFRNGFLEATLAIRQVACTRLWTRSSSGSLGSTAAPTSSCRLASSQCWWLKSEHVAPP